RRQRMDGWKTAASALRANPLRDFVSLRNEEPARGLRLEAMKGRTMKAIVWHGKEDVRCDRVTDPEIEHPRDAIIKVTSCAICGSDLHLFHNFIPAMMPGDIMGHEMMG